MSDFDDRLAGLRARFLARAADDHAALAAAREAGDREAIQRIVHSLAGGAGIFGFPEISAAARAVEEAGEEDVRPRLAHLLRLLDGRR
ncbi:Hpt domain-containing protein [Sphingomonas sp. DT-207]|uniref:Hpt domain-containing protein n=1 Tax=Sphingomonas sp. DT-207 TaxID=3396167 RepID=UPI003F1B9B12